MGNVIYVGDAEAGLVRMKADGVVASMCVTSPPYFGLRDYGVGGQIGLEDSPREYIGRLVGVFSRVWDVLADDGTLWVNIGDSYAANRGYQVPDGKVGNVGNSKGSKVPSGLKPKDLIGIPWMLAFALRDAGWYLRQEIIWSKPNPMPESVTDRCTKSHEQIFLFSKRPRYYFDAEAIKEDLADSSIGRANRKQNLIDMAGVGTLGKQIDGGVDPLHGYAGLALARGGKTGYDLESGLRNKRSVWEVATKPYKGAHFACFPEDLITPCILAGCPAGGLVLDPFMGSGTTAITAVQNGRRFAGCELNRSYVPLQMDRLGLFQMDTEWVDV